ncbi:hypothetical protein [Leisingera aquaemixtae]|uniref:Uncharacterized protein n=1 Tax=Leisingera aquaemixtae TaxID=1396826 RepID=A0A0P1HC10_9RHOB|nr:hypothetical protein [Leisingera aquaemixtae]CUI01111.1 hypothetical protein PHA8399_03252 [Leisingera aquaemixtae]
MIFIRLGSLLSYCILALGTYKAGFGLYLAATVTDHQFAARRYLASDTTGEAINQGLMYILGAVVLGLLVQIARGVSEWGAEYDEQDES